MTSLTTVLRLRLSLTFLQWACQLLPEHYERSFCAIEDLCGAIQEDFDEDRPRRED